MCTHESQNKNIRNIPLKNCRPVVNKDGKFGEI